MVLAMDPEKVKSEALDFFRKSELPAGWDWVEALSPLNLRLFAVELADAVKEATITGDEAGLAQLVADWQATAELEAAPDVLAEVRRAKSRSPVQKFVSA